MLRFRRVDQPIQTPRSRTGRHTAGMDDDVVFMVRGRTSAICQQYVDLVCLLIGAHQTSLPSDGTGRGWVARAILAAPADEPEPGHE